MAALPPAVYKILQKMLHSDQTLIMNWARDHAPDPCHAALDLGCGTGILAAAFPGPVYTGIDSDPDRIETARATHPAHSFVAGNAVLLDPEFVAKFDYVLCHGFIHHLRTAAVKELIDRLNQAATLKGKPIRALFMEPILPEKAWTNPFGFLLAKMDFGGNVRTSSKLHALFAGKVMSNEYHIPPWFWPVPGEVMQLEFRPA